MVGNIGANLDLYFNHDQFELIDDFNESLFRQVRAQVKDALRFFKKKGILHQGGSCSLDPMSEFLVFSSGRKPTRDIIDFFYNNNSTIIRKWSKLAIEDILPISPALLSSALKKSPPLLSEALNIDLNSLLVL